MRLEILLKNFIYKTKFVHYIGIVVKIDLILLIKF